MTERLYYTDSGVLDFEAKVVETGAHKKTCYTVLDRSGFYPTSGGQPHDTGKLNQVAVNDVIESEAGDVWHITDTPVGAVGQRVIGLIDRERRRHNCRNHTAQHILSAAFARLFEMETMSVHLGDEYGAVELDTATLTDTQMQAAEELANEVVSDNVEIEIIFADSREIGALPLRKPPKREGKLRIIRVGQFDYVACGGTHCATSGGVGLIKLVGVEKIRGRVLVKFLAGRLAVADYVLRFDVTDRLARSFTCHPKDLVGKVEKLTSDNKSLKQALVEAQKELLPVRAKALIESATELGSIKVVVAPAAGLEPSTATRLAVLVADEIGGLAGLVSEGRLVLATAEGSGLHAGKIAKALGPKCGLKGGGNNRTAQLGGATEDGIESYLKAIWAILKNE